MLAQLKQRDLNKHFQEFIFKPENQELLELMRGFEQSGQKIQFDSVYKTILPSLEKKYLEEGGLSYTDDERKKYIEEGGVPFLDNGYTVFGEIVKGIEVVDKICAQPTASMDRPVEDITMKVSYEILSKKEITKRTGYQY